MTVYRQIQAMGTSLDLVIPEMDEARVPELMHNLRQEIEILESVFSNYREDSEISRFNRSAPGSEFVMGDTLLSAMEELLPLAERTKGLFDFTLGAWTSQPDNKGLPQETLTAFSRLPLHERFSCSNGVLIRLQPETIIDSGGFGKGIAVRSVEKMIKNTGIQSAFISFGHSSVLAIGSHPQGESWKVGIQHPGDPEKTLGVVDIRDETLSISGNSLNNRGKFGSAGHVVNPLTGDFIRELNLAAVVSADPLKAEVLSTAYFASLGRPEEVVIAGFEDARFLQFDV